MTGSRVTWLGHSTTVIELDGVRLLTDPLLRWRVAHLRRVGPAPAVPQAVDAVLISHGHLDHLDLGSLRRLPRGSTAIAPRGLGKLLESRGFQVHEVVEGEEVRVGAVTVRATRAEHGGGKPLPGRSDAAVGYVAEASASVYFAGDTDLFDGMDGLVPALDLALLPVWGWGPSIGPGHLDPGRAAEALTLLRPRFAVPVHWGTYRPFYVSGHADFLTDPLESFLTAAARVAPQVAVRVLEPGDSLEI